jgi:hypothetical protein
MRKQTELIRYIEKEGNSLVPREYKENLPLGRWVDKQRCHYKSNYISKERIQKLNEISFVWEPQEVLWSERYDELLEYIKEHGNSLVPQEYEDNTSLGYWVQKQRTLYKTNSLSDERIQKLNEVGFVWSVLDAQWLERLQELKKYRSDHGDTLVPRSHPLGDWVWWQRLAYKSFIAKKKLGDNHQNNSDMSEVERITNISSGMNEERIQLLEAEDFIWDPKEFAWQLKFEELSEWIAINGHGAIRIRKKNKGPLEMWAARQRKMYKKHLSGEKTTLTKERIEKLQSIGFVFEIGE